MEIVIHSLPLILKGAKLTVLLSGSVLILGTLLGLFLAVVRVWGAPLFSKVVAVYTWFFRGIPTLIVLFFSYFVLPHLGIELTPFSAALVGLTLYESAYLAEIIRAGMEAVHPGQFEACQSLGISFYRTFFRVVLPQAARTIIPAFATQATEIVKHTTLASVIAVPEATQIAYSIMAYNYRPFEMFTLVAIVFLIINGSMLIFQPVAERRWAIKK